MAKKIDENMDPDFFPAIVILKLGNHDLAVRAAREFSKMQCQGEAFCFWYNGEGVTGEIYFSGERKSVVIAPKDTVTDPSSSVVWDLDDIEVEMYFDYDQMVCSVSQPENPTSPLARESGNRHSTFVVVPAARVDKPFPMNALKLIDKDFTHELAKAASSSENYGWAVVADVGNGQYKKTLYANGNLLQVEVDQMEILKQNKTAVITYPADKTSFPIITGNMKEAFLH